MNDGTNHPVFPNHLRTENLESTADAIPQSLLDEKQFQNILVTKDGEQDCIPLSTSINLKCKKRMVCFPVDFGGIDIRRPYRHWGIIHWNSWGGLPENSTLSATIRYPRRSAPNFQILVANGQFETPKSAIELKFEVGDIEFHEIFIVMENLTGPIIGLMFLQRNHTVLDLRQGILNFPFFSMQLKTADHRYSNVLEPKLNPIEVTVPPNDRVLI